jgi:hypothetical protein
VPRVSRKQLPLQLGLLHNSELFSNHWLAKRLPLEPEWTEANRLRLPLVHIAATTT